MDSLENQLLIAMPTLGDPYFNKTVTYICEHNDEGAMGLIINLPVNLSLGDLLSQLNEQEAEDNQKNEVSAKDDTESSIKQHIEEQKNNDDTDEAIQETTEIASNQYNTYSNKLEQRVLSGGPVAQQRGFVLHSPQSCWNSSLALSDEVMITTSKDILLALDTPEAPEKFMVTLGYAGWGPGQLEEELKTNSWLTAPADNNILFNTPVELRWKKATEKLGIDIAHLSSDVGHA